MLTIFLRVILPLSRQTQLHTTEFFLSFPGPQAKFS